MALLCTNMLKNHTATCFVNYTVILSMILAHFYHQKQSIETGYLNIHILNTKQLHPETRNDIYTQNYQTRTINVKNKRVIHSIALFQAN